MASDYLIQLTDDAARSAIVHLREVRHPWMTHLADMIEDQIPARIPEPGLWGVVRAEWAAVTSEWVRRSNGWQSWGGTITEWDDLIEPALIREGVE